jgi:hypothetical protein
MTEKLLGVSNTLIRLSQPQDTSRFTGSLGPCADTSAPGGTAGENDTAVTPTACAGVSPPIWYNRGSVAHKQPAALVM